MRLNKQVLHCLSCPLLSGRGDRPGGGGALWREGDLAALAPWSEGGLEGWVLPGYEDLSMEGIPWERLRRGEVEGWRLVKKASARSVARWERGRDPRGKNHECTPMDTNRNRRNEATIHEESSAKGTKEGVERWREAGESGDGGAVESGEVLYFKWARIVGAGKWIGGAFRASKAAREFELGRRMLSSGFLTPTPILIAERRTGPFLRESLLVTRGLDPGWTSARDLWRDLHDAGAAEADAVAVDLGRALRAFHDRGMLFADSRGHHWFTPRGGVDRSGGEEVLRRWAVIDLDASRLGGRAVSPGARRRLLAMCLASFSPARWTEADSRRLLGGYSTDSLYSENDIYRILQLSESIRTYRKSKRKREPMK